METIEQLGPELGFAATCAAEGVARATFYRRQDPRPEPPPRKPPARKLQPEESRHRYTAGARELAPCTAR